MDRLRWVWWFVLLLVERGLDFAGWTSVTIAVVLWALAALLLVWALIPTVSRHIPAEDVCPAFTAAVLILFSAFFLLGVKLREHDSSLQVFEWFQTVDKQELHEDGKEKLPVSLGKCPLPPCYRLTLDDWNEESDTLGVKLFWHRNVPMVFRVHLAARRDCWLDYSSSFISFRAVIQDDRGWSLKAWTGIKEFKGDGPKDGYFTSMTGCGQEILKSWIKRQYGWTG